MPCENNFSTVQLVESQIINYYYSNSIQHLEKQLLNHFSIN